jgi:hypothetical protein
MRYAGDQRCDIYVARVYTEVRPGLGVARKAKPNGHPGLERSKDSVAQCSSGTVNEAGLRSDAAELAAARRHAVASAVKVAFDALVPGEHMGEAYTPNAATRSRGWSARAAGQRSVAV